MKPTFNLKTRKQSNLKSPIYFLLAHQLSGCGGSGTPDSTTEANTLMGTNQNDLLISSSEYTNIEGLGGNDRIYGSENNDKIFPGEGADEVDAAAGDDEITLISFDDQVNGGDGTDTIFLNFSNTQVPIYVSLDSGIIYNTRAPGLDRSSFSNIENIEVISANDSEIVGSNNNNVIYTGEGSDTINSGDGNNIIGSGSGEDTVLLGPGSNSVDLGAGNDIIEVGSFASSLDGGAGTDRIIYDLASVVSAVQVNLETQNYIVDDTIFSPSIVNFEIFEFTSSVNLIIEGSPAPETIISSLGDDIIDGKGGGDVIYGGDGSDKFTFSVLSDQIDVVMDFVSGANGDVISFTKSSLNLSGTGVQEISTLVGGQKSIDDTTGAIIVTDPVGFSSEISLKTALSGVNGITTNGESLGGLICVWWKSSEQAAVVSIINDQTPQNLTLDQINTLATLSNLTVSAYSDITEANIEIA